MSTELGEGHTFVTACIILAGSSVLALTLAGIKLPLAIALGAMPGGFVIGLLGVAILSTYLARKD